MKGTGGAIDYREYGKWEGNLLVVTGLWRNGKFDKACNSIEECGIKYSDAPPIFNNFGDFIEDLSSGKTSHITDMQTDSDGSTYVLSSRLNNASDFRTDSDGGKSFLGDIVLTRISSDKSVIQTVVDTIYCCDNKGFSVPRGAMKIESDNIAVFYSEKETGSGYGQKGTVYTIEKGILGKKVKDEGYFHQSNWGWFPYFDDSGDLQHFSFSGYYPITNMGGRGQSISPNTFKERMLASRLRRAGLPGMVETESQLSQLFLRALKTLTPARTPIASANPVVAHPFIGGAAQSAAAPIKGRTFPPFIDIPAQYAITSNKGCRVNNPSPKPNESVTWTGPCRNGLADGHGMLAWFENGKPSGEPKQEYLSKGFFLKPAGSELPDMLVSGRSDSTCRIIVPINAIKEMKSLFDVEYEEKCPQNASTLLHEDRHKTRANILFNGQLFATFDGTVTKGAIPIAGVMKFFDGTTFTFNGRNPFTTFITPDNVIEWRRSIDVARGSSGAAQVSADVLNIKIGFNAKPSAPVEASDKILFFPVETIAGATSLKMRYDIGPAPKAKLTANSYVVSLKAEVKLDKTTSMGWFGVGENNSIVKLVDVRLDKKNGYRATGEVLLSELQSYAHGMGVTITNKASRPTVTVVGITEEQ